jgi:UDP-glucose:(heptosyl)LPS alpha-1,3-glucosyltransferase
MNRCCIFWEAATYWWGFRKRYRPCETDLLHIITGDLPNGDVATVQYCIRAQVEARREAYPLLSVTGLRKRFSPSVRLALALESELMHKRSFRKIIAVSTTVKEEILRFYDLRESDVEVIPNGVDLERFRPDTDGSARKRLDEEFGLRPDDFVVLYCGYVHEHKGLGHIIDALAMLDDRRIKLIAAGASADSPWGKQVERLRLGDRVILAGPRTDVEVLCAAANVFCLPSLSEGFSLASLEAAASSLPILGTRIAGLSQLIHEGENGYFVKRDAADIAEKLALLASQPETCARMGRLSRALVERDYGWPVIAQKHLRLYEELVQ